MLRVLFCFTLLIMSGLSYAHEISVTDLFKREVTIPDNVTKVVAIGSGALRMLVYAGAHELVAGRESYEDILEKDFRPYTYNLSDSYYTLPVVSEGGPGKMPDIEQIKKLDPDVIFAATYSSGQLDMISRLTGIPVVGLTYGDIGHTNLEKIKESLRLIGYITHTQQRVQHVLNKMAMLRKDLYSRSYGQEKKSVFMSSIAFKGARGFGSSEKDHPSCLMLHIANIADDIETKPFQSKNVMLDTETVVSKNPDYIFIDITGIESVIKDYDKLTRIEAVRKGNVYSVMPYNWYNSNIENIFLTAYFIGKIVYPDRFSDISMEEAAKDIYNSFLMTNPYDDLMNRYDVFKQILFEKDSLKFIRK